MKEFTRVKNNRHVLFRFKGIKNLKKLIDILRTNSINDRIEIEYIFIKKDGTRIFSTYFLNENQTIVGHLYPYVNS